MESALTKLKTNLLRFQCPRQTVAIIALVLSLCVASVVSEYEDSSTLPDITDTDHLSSDVPDVTYFPLPDGTPPPTEFQSSWYDGISDNIMWRATSSDFDISTLSYTSTDNKKSSVVSALSPDITTTSFSTQLSSQRSTLQPPVTSDSAKTASTRTSSTKVASFSPTSLDSTTQTSTSSVSVTAEMSVTPPLESPALSETTPPTMTTATDLSALTSTVLLSTTPLISSTSPTAAVPNSRFCNLTRSSTYLTKCTFCLEDISCKKGDIQAQDSLEQCALIGRFPGCKVKCLHIYQEPACCQGYWGDNCDECPGGHEKPCNGHGECQTNNGICLCQPGFIGTACELCEDSTKYGSECSQDCACVHGTCHSGVLGDGSCICDSGYKGELCDREIPECEKLSCHSEDIQKWRCADVNGTATCVCAAGYKYAADLNDCTAHNPCNDSAYPCGPSSQCEQTGPNRFKCKCEDGYTGDGFVCLPIDPCQTNRGGCHETTRCLYTRPNQHICLCKLGYERSLQDTGCSLTNVCTKTSCDPNALCETTEPFKFSCTCKEGYAGNGTVCYGNILERIKDINSNNPRFRQDLQYAITIISRFYLEPLTKHGPFTLFVPNDRAFREVIRDNKGFDKFLNDEDRAVQILRQHILIGQFKLEDLQSYDTFYTLQGNAAQLQVRVIRDIFRYKLQDGTDRAKILASNIIASNGMIHIVNNLLTLKPEISGDKTKTAMDLIKLEGAYNRFETLINSAGLSDIFTQPNITVFAPENRAWDALPTGTLDYLMNDQDGQEKLKVILKNHVFPGMLGVTRLINTPYIKSFANFEIKVTVSSLGQIRLDSKVSISQVNIPCSTGFYHHIEGILIPSYIDQLLPNRCTEVMIKEVKGACVNCRSYKPQCPQSTDIPTDKSTVCVYYSNVWYGASKSFMGCAWICNREVKIPKCCPGFYGADCIPCPGGYRNPCSGKGECLDGLTGSGLCFCERDFMGTACDQCRQKDVFGPYCNETCTCLYGLCDEGPKGTGLCKKGTCQLGYQGDNCDKKLVPCHGDAILCHAHAKCFLDDSNVARCQCEMGYEGDGDDCKEIDPCANDDKGGCHQQATCTKVGPGVSRCECNNGWFGDGFYCSPKTPCTNNTDCDVNAKCYNSEPGQYHCVCKVGYKGNGKTCDLVNLCVENNGGCHPKAICTPLRAGERNCTCPENLAGDGFTCSGSIADEVMVHPNLTRLAGLLKIVDKSNNMLDNLEDKMTLLAPSDVAMEAFMGWFSTWNRTSYWQDEENVIWFLNFHTIYNDYSTDDLIALEGILKSFPTMYDGFSLHMVKVNNILRIYVNHSDFATLTQPGIPTLNGYIHIIDKVLEPFLPDDQVPTLNETLSSKPQYKLFYEAMQITGVMDQVKDLDEFTVFVPTNDAIKQLNRTVNAEFIKYYIVPKLVFTPSIVDSDSFETLLGSQHRLLMSVLQNMVQVNGIQITRSDILLDGGVMHEIGGVLHPVLNRCDFNSTEMTFGDCGDCTNLSLACPQGYSSISPPRIIKYECSFIRYPDAGWHTIGCKQICVRNITKLECCGGYFGPLCKECHGGAENPCSGNGRCYAGLTGNGTCACDKGFSGPDCGRCEDTNQAPPNCNVTYNSCGYNNGNCSEHAVCSDTSSGVSCRCPLGYVGDGYTCRSQCDILDNGGCHLNASCVFNVSRRAVQCICKHGFHGNGTWCQQNIDPCASDNGGCDLDRATCTFIVPKTTDMFQDSASCQCRKGYWGNGKLCSTDIMDAISRIPDLRYLYAQLLDDEKLNNTNVTQLLRDHKARSTVFLPVSTEWHSLDFASLVVEGVVFRLPDYQVAKDVENVTSGYIIGHLESLSGQMINVTVNDKKQFFANDVRLVQENVETSNGIIHLTEGPVVRSDHAQVAASRDTGGSASTVVIACVVAAVVLVLVAVVGAIIYVKKHHEGVFKIFMRSESNSESNISFARLSAQEEEDDAFKAPDNARYDNPIFNDPDLL